MPASDPSQFGPTHTTQRRRPDESMRPTIVRAVGNVPNGCSHPLLNFPSSRRNSSILDGSEIEPYDRILSCEISLLTGNEGASEAAKQLNERFKAKSEIKNPMSSLMLQRRKMFMHSTSDTPHGISSRVEDPVREPDGWGSAERRPVQTTVARVARMTDQQISLWRRIRRRFAKLTGNTWAGRRPGVPLPPPKPLRSSTGRLGKPCGQRPGYSAKDYPHKPCSNDSRTPLPKSPSRD